MDIVTNIIIFLLASVVNQVPLGTVNASSPTFGGGGGGGGGAVEPWFVLMLMLLSAASWTVRRLPPLQGRR